jgi:polyhydroxyalkanoate synthesis regulator phasin
MSVSGIGGPRVPSSTPRSESTQRATATAPKATEQRATGHSQTSEFEAPKSTRTEQNPLTAEENQQVSEWAKSMVEAGGFSPEAGDRMKADLIKRMGEFVKKNPDATPEQIADEMKKAGSGAQAEEMFNKNWLDQMMNQIQQRAKEALSGLFK